MLDIKQQFEYIYIENHARLVRFATLYLKNEDDAQNVVQDVFVELWHARERFDELNSPLAYLLKITKLRSIDLIRKNTAQRRRVTKIMEDLTAEEREDMINLEILDTDKIVEEFNNKALKDAIDSLPEQCRNIFILSKVKGKKQKDIAIELGISVNSVESQMGIAYKKLRESLKDKMYNSFELAILLLLLSNS